MEKYEIPEIKIIRMEVADIITISDPNELPEIEI